MVRQLTMSEIRKSLRQSSRQRLLRNAIKIIDMELCKYFSAILLDNPFEEVYLKLGEKLGSR